MAELIATGNAAQRQCRFSIFDGQEATLGRAPRNGWAVPWDRLISREHALLQLAEGELLVTRLDTARNPIYLDEEPRDQFSVRPGGEFRIGETMFLFRDAMESDFGDSVMAEHVLSDEQALQSDLFTNPSSCLHALCKMPDLIAQSGNDEELAAQVVELLLDTVRDSLAAAVMRYEGPPGSPVREPVITRWNSRGDSVQRFQPSRRLVQRAMQRERSVVHLWLDDIGEGSDEFTICSDLDWAFCTPIMVGQDDRWCLYVSGKRRFAGTREVGTPKDLIGELRTAELIAKFVGSVRKVRTLEQQHLEMRRFFSPAVVETLAGGRSEEALEPRSGPVSVLFCDVRGFSLKVEATRDLHALLQQVSHVLSVMTRGILKYEGVIADFQGDAALGFWGWPTDHGDTASMACRAALLIHDTFATAQRDKKNPLHGFHVGIGLAHGDAIAGRIGAQEQIKVGVFGPVVNLSSRLQDFTKQVGTPILLDGPMAEKLSQSSLHPDDASLRRVGLFRPPGMEKAVDVHAILSSSTTVPLEPEGMAAYLRAVDAIGAGEWGEARELLRSLKHRDNLSEFLLRVLSKSGEKPPIDWDGVISLDREGSISCRTGQTTQVIRPGEE